MPGNLMELELDVPGHYTVRLRNRGCFGVVTASSKYEAEEKVLDFIMNELENNDIE